MNGQKSVLQIFGFFKGTVTIGGIYSFSLVFPTYWLGTNGTVL